MTWTIYITDEYTSQMWLTWAISMLQIDYIHKLDAVADPGFGQGGAQLWSAQFCQHSGVEWCEQSEHM